MTRLELHSIVATAQAQCTCKGEGSIKVFEYSERYGCLINTVKDCERCYSLKLLLKTLEKE